MIGLIVVVGLLNGGAHADPKLARATAMVNLLWARYSGPYPKLPVMDIRPCRADFTCASINGVPHELIKPTPRLAELPGVKVLGIARDPNHPWLLLRTLEDDPTLIWALYRPQLRRLKFAGYDKYKGDLDGDVDADAVARAAAQVDNLTLLKYLTTKNAAQLLLTREEISAGLSCASTYPKQLERDWHQISDALTFSDLMDTRLVELRGMVAIITLDTIEDQDYNRRHYCERQRLVMWKNEMILIHARTEAALSDLPASAF